MKDKALIELVIVLILVVWGLWALNKDSAPTNNTSTTPVVDTTTPTTNPKTISYTQALVKYKNARLQLDERCQASPSNMSFKNGTNIMIDNRSGKTRLVKAGFDFSVKAWGFKIINLTSATLPVTWYVDCDSSQNVATILLQK